jgi:uncharacterized protein (TIGR02453 family)
MLAHMQTKRQRPPEEAGVTDSVFQGFSAWAFEWFTNLEQDNSREYFKATRERYESELRGPFTLMLHELSGTFGGIVHVFRQQNDMRFAPSTPYKTRTYGVLDRDAPVRARLYADVSARGLYAGTGYHRLASDQLRRYRDAVVDDQLGARLAEAVLATEAAGLELMSDSTASVPRGFPRDHPRGELLKFRSLLVGRLMTSTSGIGRDDALHHVAVTWRAAAMLTDWLDDHVGQSTLAPRERWPRRPASTSYERVPVMSRSRSNNADTNR